VEEYAEAPPEGGIVMEVLGPRRRRPRLPLPRRHRIVVRLSDEEVAAVAAGAGRLGLSRGAFLSAAGVAVAAGSTRSACRRGMRTWATGCAGGGERTGWGRRG